MTKHIKKKIVFICGDYAKYLIACQQPWHGTIKANPNNVLTKEQDKAIRKWIETPYSFMTAFDFGCIKGESKEKQ